MFSKRTHWPLTPNRQTQCLEALWQKGIRIDDLTESNPTCCGFSYPPEKILKPFAASKNLIYRPTPKGAPAARKAIAQSYEEKGIRVDPEQIVLTPGTSDSYAMLFRLLLNPDDRILIPQPSYPLFELLAGLSGIGLDRYALDEEKKWRIDFDGFTRLIQKKMRAVLAVNPNNPTGSYLKQNELSRLNTICRANNLSLVTDEVFSDFSFHNDPSRVISTAENHGALTFTLGGISKMLGLPQMKLGWIVVSGPRELVKDAMRRLEIIADTYLSVNTPVQNALPDWMRFRCRIRSEILKRLLQNRRFLSGALRHCRRIRLLEAEGGWYAILKFMDERDEEAIVLNLLETEHLYIHPGYFYDFADGTHFILSLLPPAAVFQRAVKRLISSLSAI